MAGGTSVGPRRHRTSDQVENCQCYKGAEESSERAVQVRVITQAERKDNGAKRADEYVDDDSFVAVGANGNAAYPPDECPEQQGQDYHQRNSLRSVASQRAGSAWPNSSDQESALIRPSGPVRLILQTALPGSFDRRVYESIGGFHGSFRCESYVNSVRPSKYTTPSSAVTSLAFE